MITPFNNTAANELTAWDVSAWIGSYPFRHIKEQSLHDLQLRARQNQVKHVIVSGYDNLFAQNGLEYWGKWAQAIAQQHDDETVVEYWPVVNPSLPGELRRLEEGLRKWPCRGIRLLPAYHNYRAWDPALAQLMAMAAEHGLIVQVFVRIADERWHWMHQQPALEFTQDVAYLTSMFEQNHLVLCGASLGELQSISSRMRTHPSLYADLSRVRGPAFVIDGVDQILPINRLLFGSLWPVQILEASLWEITTSKLAMDLQQAILMGNAQQLIEHASPVKRTAMEPIS